MQQRARYLFDDDFGRPKPARPADPDVPMIELAQHEAAMKRCDEAAYLRGVLEGRAQVEGEETARLAGAMQRLAHGFAEIAEQLGHVQLNVERDAVALAVAVARKIAQAALDRHPGAEVEALARSTFAELRATPHVVVRLNDSLVEGMTQRLERIAQETGFGGRLVILGDPGLALSDVRIEWADGGVVRDQASLEAAISALAARPPSVRPSIEEA